MSTSGDLFDIQGLSSQSTNNGVTSSNHTTQLIDMSFFDSTPGVSSEPHQTSTPSKPMSIFSSLSQLKNSPFYEEEFIEQTTSQKQLKSFDITQPLVSNEIESVPQFTENQIDEELVEQQEQHLIANVTSSGGIRIVPSEAELKDFNKKIMGMDIVKITKALNNSIMNGQGKQRTKALGYLKFLLETKKNYVAICQECNTLTALGEVDVSTSVIKELKQSIEQLLQTRSE